MAHRHYFIKGIVGLRNLMFRKCYFQRQEKCLTHMARSKMQINYSFLVLFASWHKNSLCPKLPRKNFKPENPPSPPTSKWRFVWHFGYWRRPWMLLSSAAVSIFALKSPVIKSLNLDLTLYPTFSLVVESIKSIWIFTFSCWCINAHDNTFIVTVC